MGDINYFRWAQRIDDEARTKYGQVSRVHLRVYTADETIWEENHWITPVANGVKPCNYSYGAAFPDGKPRHGHAHLICPRTMPIANDTANAQYSAHQRTADLSIPDASHVIASEEFYGHCYSNDGHETISADGLTDHGQ